ncbi:MAG: hypothetical protein KIT31_01600 [Deltaproteobacteria bacterium]|nr:hypothetical protein [Deltaproteobacteria bacterium]
MLTTRLALAATTLLAAVSTAEAKPRRVVITDIDGPRALVDASNAALREALADYDLVAKKKWKEAQSAASRTSAGPASWAKAARASGVDAVIEGWVQEEGRHKMLTIIVRDAQSGVQLDQLSVKVKESGMSASAARELQQGLEDRFQWIEGQIDTGADALPKVGLGGKPAAGAKKPPKETVQETATDDDDEPAPRSKKKSKKKPAVDPDDDNTDEVAAPKETKDAKEAKEAAPKDVAVAARKEGCYDIFGDCSKDPDEVLGLKKPHVPRPTPRFRFGGGGFVSSRSLSFDADNIENISQFQGVAGKGLSLSGEVYPWPLSKQDGQLSGLGFSMSVYKSVGSIVGIDTDDTTGDYTTNQNGFMGAIHWRQPLGIVHIDTEVGYSQNNFVIEDPPENYEVPDTAYTAVHAGVHVDLSIGQRATIGFGGRYHYVTGTGDLSSTQFYGPGEASGFSLDTSFVIPLPKDMYVRGVLDYTRFTTSFSGGGFITDDEGVREGVDANVALHVNVGIQF